MASIRDVAKIAGVGLGTVSRVINQSSSVNEETRQKVLKVIEELGYVPNELARNMSKQKTNIIAFILPHSNHSFFSEITYYVERKLYALGYKLMICNSGSDREKELDFIHMLRKNLVDGIIFLTNNPIDPLIDPKLPIVSFDRQFKGVPFVTSDNYTGGRIAATKLLEKNPKKLVFIGNDAQAMHSPIQTTISQRRIGFLDVLHENQFENVVILEYPKGDFFIPVDYINQIITEHADADGIFAISDMLAGVVIQQLQRLGKKVPGDVSVMGYDGVKNYWNTSYEITSIRQPIEDIAEALVKMIIARIHGESCEHVILPVSFVEGNTV